MLFVGTSIIHPSTEGVFLLCNILDLLIYRLKVNHSADEAIQQIKDRQYALRFEGKFGEKAEYTGRILAVGIAYHKDDIKKLHECKVEVLREKIV